ncbi:MAG: phosphate transport system permease protein, partial [Frankiales bacterium]|nr:phosphate transport system permease protein [Frankiales bacterium]
MSATILEQIPGLGDDTRRLHAPVRLALLALTVLISLLLFAVTPLQGQADFVVFVVVAFAAVQTATSFALEGRRHALDRLLSLGVHLALLAAVVPLVSVLSYTVYKGVKKLDGQFLTH